MAGETCTIDRIAPTNNPVERPIGYQNWSNLLFVHWRVPCAHIEPLIPPELTVDTFDGDAWVAVVPFAMSGVRPWWCPPLAGVSRFLETNLRTYVHRDGSDPGVWFLSLEASNSLAVRVARRRWGLSYYRSAMGLQRQGARIRYESARLWPEPAGAYAKIEAEIGEWIAGPDPSLPPGLAAPGTLEHFLAERYILYSKKPRGPLLKARVHHAPYRLRAARLVEIDESLRQAAGIAQQGDVEHVLFSDGVNVKIYGLRPAAGCHG